MPPNKSILEPWLSLLRELDSAVDTEVRLDCMGGFVVTMVYGFSRPAADLDVLEIAPRESRQTHAGTQHARCSPAQEIQDLDPVG
jgi:hypothetical protein